MEIGLALPSGWHEYCSGVWPAMPINLSDMQEYAKSLREASGAIDEIDDAALERELTAPVFGKRNVGFVLRLAAMQMAIHTGEISAAKGMQGLQGLPF